MIRVYGDFNNVDSKGRLILYHAEDTIEREVDLRTGLRVIVWDADVEVEGVLEYEDGEWRAQVIEDTARRKNRS